jgi:dolichol kinase
MAVEGKATLPLSTRLTAAGVVTGVVSGAAVLPLATGLSASGEAIVVAQGGAVLPFEIGITAHGIELPLHQHVEFSFQLSPTRIQYEK